MRILRYITLAAALLVGAGAAQAQLITNDPIHTALSKLSWAKQVADMANQLRVAKYQLDQAKATFDSLNGSRGIASLLHNPTLYDYLPPDIAARLRNTNLSLSGTDAMLAQMRVLSIDETMLDPNSQTAADFRARQISNANYQLLNEQGYQAANDRIRQLDALTKSIDGATDPMKINALQVRVQTEQALIANEQARLSLLASMAANAERVREQRSREIVMKATTAPMPTGW